MPRRGAILRRARRDGRLRTVGRNVASRPPLGRPASGISAEQLAPLPPPASGAGRAAGPPVLRGTGGGARVADDGASRGTAAGRWGPPIEPDQARAMPRSSLSGPTEDDIQQFAAAAAGDAGTASPTVSDVLTHGIGAASRDAPPTVSGQPSPPRRVLVNPGGGRRRRVIVPKERREELQHAAEVRQALAPFQVGWVVMVVYGVAGFALYWAMHELYFGSVEKSCPQDYSWNRTADAVENGIDPAKYVAGVRVAILTFVLMKLLQRFGCVREFESTTLLQASLVMGTDGEAETIQRAGWEAIAADQAGDATAEPQSSWAQVLDARKLTQRQALFIATTHLALWHWLQPVVYLWMLARYQCYVASLGSWQPVFGSIVAAREVLYLCSTLLATCQCPVFLLMDPFTAWNEAGSRMEKLMRASLYVLTPHNYVALCLANRFRSWRRLFMGLAGIQILADLASCLALGVLLATGFSNVEEATLDLLPTPTALIFLYVITAAGFVLFFGPLSVVSSLRGAVDGDKHKAVRFALAGAGSSLLCALTYILTMFLLLILNKYNPYCDGFVFQTDDPCNGNGQCYGAGQCLCELGFGPEISYGNERLCARSDMPCTGSQLKRAIKSGADGSICCAHHGNVVAKGCECEPGYGPAVPDNSLTPAVLMCSWHVVCAADQLRRAQESDNEAACGGHHFPGSQLLIPEWGKELHSWSNSSVSSVWAKCCSTLEDCDTAAKFHAACDAHAPTLTVARNTGGTVAKCDFQDVGCDKTNPGNFTFGGFVRATPQASNLLHMT
eukprot:COSAG04_NODE_1760_length_5665_cov_4.392203_2_plen_786_part_00